jgi:hypothetical protein
MKYLTPKIERYVGKEARACRMLKKMFKLRMQIGLRQSVSVSIQVQRLFEFSRRNEAASDSLHGCESESKSG